jgi:hypothetical protein
MSTDKLQAVSNTVADILSEPSSPHTYFDDDPSDAPRISEKVAKAPDILGQGSDIPRESSGKVASRKFGISPNALPDAHVVRDTGNGSVGIARQSLADQIPVARQRDGGNEQLLMGAHETASARSDPRTASMSSFPPADSGNRISPGGWSLRGFVVILLAAGIGVAAVMWFGSRPDAAKTALSQPAPQAQIAPTAAVPLELTPLLQSMARDLASVGKEIEQLKAGRELTARDNANLSEQLKASQEQLTRVVARLSEQLQASQDQAARDNANVAEQIKAIQDQLARVVSQASEPKKLPKIAATSPRLPPLPLVPEAPAARKPVPTAPPAPSAAKPKAEKPKLSSAPRPPAPAR